jgi:hypothetical protein
MLIWVFAGTRDHLDGMTREAIAGDNITNVGHNFSPRNTIQMGDTDKSSTDNP